LEDESRDMALLGRMALGIREYFEYVLLGYIFLIYASIIMAGYLISASLASHFKGFEQIILPVGIFTSLLLSVVAINMVLARVIGSFRRYLPSQGRPEVIWVLMIVIIILLSAVYPPSSTVSWMPGLGLGLIGYAFTVKEWKGWKMFLISGGIIIIFSPIVVLETDVLLALGVTGASYSIAGIASLYEALKALTRE